MAYHIQPPTESLAYIIERDYFIKHGLSKGLQERLRRSDAKLKKAQFRAFLLTFLSILLGLLNPGTIEFRLACALLFGVIFLVGILPILLIIIIYTFGNDRRKFDKWYKKWLKKKTTMEELYAMFDFE